MNQLRKGDPKIPKERPGRLHRVKFRYEVRPDDIEEIRRLVEG